MKMCPNCHSQVNDDSVYCPVCGTGIDAAPQYIPQSAPQSNPQYNSTYQQPPMYAPPVPFVDPYDHTSEFDPQDVSENKVFAMVCYLLGPLGILMAQLAAGKSKYTVFHIKQAMMLTVAEILGLLALSLCACLLWEIRLRAFMFFVVAIALIGLAILHLVCFFQICKGKAKEVYIVRNLKFLK